MKKLKWILSLAVFVLAVAALAGASGIARAEENTQNVIPSKVYIGDVAIGGMTEEEAKQAVQEDIDNKLKAQIVLRAGDSQTSVTAKELGVQWANTHITGEAANIGKIGNLIRRYKDMKDLEHEDKVYDIEYSVDETVLQAWLDANAASLNQDAVDNGLKREDGEFVFIPGQEGIEVDVEKSAEMIADYFTGNWNESDGEISLAANVVEPRCSEEELRSIKDVLGSYSTNFGDSSTGRAKNVTTATGKIDGTILYPGEQFSVYDAIAPLDASGGYELAGAYENGTTVESYGGGVCQVSTTLYNAAIRAELEITQRSNHSMLVSYVQLSMDAAIAGTYKDLKFVNSLDTPIYIEGYTQGKTVYFNIFGKETRPANRKVDFVSETLEEIMPAPKFEASADPVGVINQTQKKHVGNTARLWKIVTVDGQEESREVFNTSTYNASPDIYSVGTATSNPDAAYAITTALETQDEATIRAAAEQWNDGAIAQREQQAAIEAQQEEERKKQEEEKKNSDKKDSNKHSNKKDDNSESDNTDSNKEEDSES